AVRAYGNGEAPASCSPDCGRNDVRVRKTEISVGDSATRQLRDYGGDWNRTAAASRLGRICATWNHFSATFGTCPAILMSACTAFRLSSSNRYIMYSHCVERITAALSANSLVRDVRVSLEGKTASFEYDGEIPPLPSELVDNIEACGR